MKKSYNKLFIFDMFRSVTTMIARVLSTHSQITIASDMLSVENQDSYIGWGEKERLRTLKHLAVVSTCVATQRFSFNS